MLCSMIMCLHNWFGPEKINESLYTHLVSQDAITVV